MSLDKFPIPALNADDFCCPICMELSFKPVASACGHVHCFWCVHVAMDPLQQSRCPMCRQPFDNFPRICWTLHKFLAEAFPSEYLEREESVKDYEQEKGMFSPAAPSSLTPSNEASGTRQVSSSDFSCPACQNLLEDPLVLNCGHAVCIGCKEEASKKGNPKGKFGAFPCPKCGEVQPEARLAVCGQLRLVAELVFPEGSRKKGSTNAQKPETVTRNRNPSETPELPAGTGAEGSKTNADLEGGQQYSRVQLAWQMQSLALEKMRTQSDEERQESLRALEQYHVHFGVGCDGCGAYPITGPRYQCTECPEAIGYDLCGECQSLGGTVPGRFNQSHKQGHKMRQVSNFPGGIFLDSFVEL